MSLARNTLVQAGFTLLSRLFGYARDRAISNLLGAGWVGDALATAQSFPNLFRRILAEGAFSQAFVPFYAKTQAESGDKHAAEIASQAFSVLTLAATAVTILAQLSMPWIMLVIHGGYADMPQAFQFAIVLTQITMPYLVGMAMSSLFSGVLSTAGRFALSAAAPTLLNVTILASIIWVREPTHAALNAAVAITIAGMLQAGALYIGCRRLGVRMGFRLPRLTPEVKAIMAVMGPSVIAGSATHINVLVSQSLSSYEIGAKSWLYAADRLFQLPLGLIGVAIGVALLPRLARAVAEPEKGDATKALDEAFVLSMAFSLPAAAALVVVPFFLMQGFWSGGQFTEVDARATADALFHYGWGVPAFVLIRILAPPFFARGDSKRPMNFALIGVGVNVVVGASLFFGLRAFDAPGYVGLAIAASVSGWVNALLLGGTLLREKIWQPQRLVLGKLVRILLATASMSIVLGIAGLNRAPIEAAFEARIFFGKELATLLVCFVGAIVYAATAFLVKAVTVSDIKLALQRPPNAGPVGPDDAF
jgi:putative peptidoglycan lipid II flippase